jgi:hypothetical protein
MQPPKDRKSKVVRKLKHLVIMLEKRVQERDTKITMLQKKVRMLQDVLRRRKVG